MKTPFEAIALEYGQRKTPRVVAKGQAELAQRIIEEAKRQGIYVAEDPLSCVVRGCGEALERIDEFKDIFATE